MQPSIRRRIFNIRMMYILFKSTLHLKPVASEFRITGSSSQVVNALDCFLIQANAGFSVKYFPNSVFQVNPSDFKSPENVCIIINLAFSCLINVYREGSRAQPDWRRSCYYYNCYFVLPIYVFYCLDFCVHFDVF